MKPDPTQSMPRLAVDIGGTHTRVAVVDRAAKILDRTEISTHDHRAAPFALVEIMRHLARDRPVDGAIVGVPGPVSYREGRLELAPNLPHAWIHDLSEAWLEDNVGLPVTLANDADLAAVGETYFGAGRSFADLVYLTISTGVGAGVVMGDRLVHGRQSVAEIGHTVIDHQAWAQGEPATLELLGSGKSLVRMATDHGLDVAGGSEVEALVTKGDPIAVDIWQRAVEAVVIGVLNLVRIFGPEVVIIGGGLGVREQFFLPVCHRARSLQYQGAPRVQIRLADLGDDAGLMGAAAWSRAFVPQSR